MKVVLVDKPRVPGIILDWIEWRIAKHKNVIWVVNGATGSGKTYAAITQCKQIAERLGTNFTIKDNVGFSFSELLKKTMLPQNQKPGTPFLFEEVGAFGSGSSSRQWQSKANLFFLSFLQTTRHRQQILVFTCPQFAFLDKGARMLCHLQSEVEKIDFQKKQCHLKTYILQVNGRSGKIYFKFLRFKKNGLSGKINKLIVDHPPKDLVEDYEKMKHKYTAALNQMILDDDKPKEKKVKKSKVDPEKLKVLCDKGVTLDDMSKVLGVSRVTVIAHKKKLGLFKK